jgi:putative IMPACT (imprinted ancient) family translation regulator
MCGESAEHMIVSDDGEPQRTAGIPILEVLKHHELTNTLAVVIRYFGGIKLGAGGLVRAYTKSIAETLKLSRFYHKKMVQCYELTLPYSLVDTFEYQYKDKIEIIDKTYLEHVSLKIRLLESDLSLFDEIKHLIINIKPLEPETLYVLEA